MRKDAEHRLAQGVASPWKTRAQVYRYRRVDPAPKWILDQVRDRIESEHVRRPGGIFVAEGWGTEGLGEPRVYDPTAEAGQILTDATRTNPDDDTALLAFVNVWGLLGCRRSRVNADVWDVVYDTRLKLRELAQAVRWLAAMQAGHWRSSAIPVAGELRALVPKAPKRTRSADGRHALAWKAFTNSINKCLQHVPLQAFVLPSVEEREPGERVWGVKPMLRPQCLLDLLWLQVWRRATETGTRLQECGSCSGLFPVQATNAKRSYCSAKCKSRANFRAWYAKPMNREKTLDRRRRERLEEVARPPRR